LNLLKAFKTCKLGPGRLSKAASVVLLAFQKVIFHQKQIGGFKNQQELGGPADFPKLSVQLRIILYPIGAKDLNSLAFKSFVQIKSV
jgi:hypothetical protein